jgi:hypothetical protein
MSARVLAQSINISDVGSSDPSVRAMWTSMKSLFPHTNLGSTALHFFALRIINFILLMIGSVAVAVIIYSAIRIIISRGENVDEPKKALMYAALGLALAVVADIVIAFAIMVITAAAS